MADRIILQPSHQKENLDPLWDPWGWSSDSYKTCGKLQTKLEAPK
jgi:hypothetical protein